MRTITLLLLTIILSGCATVPRGQDAYRFDHREWYEPEKPIVFVEHKSLEDLRSAAPVRGKGEVMAWSVLTKDRCIVHIIDPKVSYEPKWIGHEIAHCLYGRWHK